MGVFDCHSLGVQFWEGNPPQVDIPCLKCNSHIFHVSLPVAVISQLFSQETSLSHYNTDVAV